MRLSRSALAALLPLTGLLIALWAAPAAASPSGWDERLAPDPTVGVVEEPSEEASVHGKYRVLLRRISCPEDLKSYGRFNDYGPYSGTEWHGHKNLPAGHWVYVYPDWYIWRDCTDAIAPAAPPPPAVKTKIKKTKE
jgi:hypothetical protein